MHFLKKAGLTVIILAAGVGAIAYANERDEALKYVGDCVDIVAQVEGAEAMTPDQKWEQFSTYCAERYADR